MEPRPFVPVNTEPTPEELKYGNELLVAVNYPLFTHDRTPELSDYKT